MSYNDRQNYFHKGLGAEDGLFASKPVIICPYCEGGKVIRKGLRRNKLGDIQLYYCKHCEKKFSPFLNKHRTYPVRVILDALSHYSRLLSYRQAADAVSEKYGLSVSRQSVANWHASFASYLTFDHWREKAVGRFAPHELITEHRLLHGLVYIYKCHTAKLALILEQRRGGERFVPLADYLRTIPQDCPHRLFRSSQGRASNLKGGFETDGLTIKPCHDNAAVRTARLVLQAVANNKRRHEVLQDFMLTNDSATVAVEVPVMLAAEDLEAIREQGANLPLMAERGEAITGHIDLVQLRFGYVHILDYKPGARRDKPVEQLLFYAVALSYRSGIPLKHFKCAWFDDQCYFEFKPVDAIF